jgi:RimJ/RimL family protein N-acetyltransferase
MTVILRRFRSCCYYSYLVQRTMVLSEFVDHHPSPIVEGWNPPLRPMYSPTLIGRYVRVDPMDIDRDLPLLYDALGGNDGSINERIQWWGMPPFHSQHDLKNMLQQIEAPMGCCVNIFRVLGDETNCGDDGSEDLASMKVAGMASYIGTNVEHGTTEVGYVVHGAAMARSPSSTEAHHLLAMHAFETMKYRRYEWKCDSNNLPSGNAALRYGFTFEGCFRHHRVTAKSRNRDTNWYSIIDSEWPSRKEALERWLDPNNFDDIGLQKRRLQEFREDAKET